MPSWEKSGCVKVGEEIKTCDRSPWYQPVPGLGSISGQKSDTCEVSGRDMITQNNQGVTHCPINLPQALA